MNMYIFAIYDSKSENYGRPFFVRTRGEAIRFFTEAANDRSTNIGKYPGDFTLFELGTYEDNTGIFTQHAAFINIGNAVSFYNGPTIVSN